MRTCKAVLSYGNAFKDGNILAKALRLGTIILVLSKINGSSNRYWRRKSKVFSYKSCDRKPVNNLDIGNHDNTKKKEVLLDPANLLLWIFTQETKKQLCPCIIHTAHFKANSRLK